MRHFVLFAVALPLVGVSEGFADPLDGKEAAKIDYLADWPSDAPLQLRPRVGRAALDEQAAEMKGRQYLGIDKAKELRLAPAYLTDNDSPFLRPQKRAIWLAEVRDHPIPASQGKPGTFPHLYVAIDAETGQLIEAFTPPAQPWWREKKQVIGPAHEKFFRETGQTLESPAAPPKLTLTDALRGLSNNDGHGQIVVRYAVYSNGNRSTPAVERRPALLVFREGLSIHSSHGGEVTGRSVLVRDAETGALLHNESYGNPISPARADEQKPQAAKKAQGIQAEVRGTLHFENGHGYFISVKPADKAEEEIRVWLRIVEDKVLVRKLQGLKGKEVIAKGKLAQMPENVRASVPPLGIYLHHGFEIEHTGANLRFSAAPRHQAADKKPADPKVTEIRLERSGGKESGPQDVLTLRADGTAIYEGKKNVERVGRHIGKPPRHGFHDSFPLLAEMYVSLGRQGGTAGKPTESVTKITLTVIRNGKAEEVEDWCPGIDERLWALEMAIRGVAADIRWEKAEGK